MSSASTRSDGTGRYRPSTTARLPASCDECRRRRIRCSREKPRCANCVSFDTKCEARAERAQRGPKKGYLKELQDKIITLEAQLAEQQHRNDVLEQQAVSHRSNTSSFETGDLWSSHNAEGRLPDQVAAELEEIYFDRIHPGLPMLHYRRHMLRSRFKHQDAARACLQSAMQTIACLTSSRYAHRHEHIYSRTLHMLGTLHSSDTNDDLMRIKHVQAWILITIYEMLRARHHQAWISSGRLLRLVQLLGLHELDKVSASDGVSAMLSSTEEKRRTFWIAYLLDHILCIRAGRPVTIQEHLICTRLPVAEAEFQAGSHTVGQLLSEAITTPATPLRSFFNESIIFTALCGRAILHRHHRTVQQAYGEDDSGSFDQPLRLRGLASDRLDYLAQNSDTTSGESKSLSRLAHILGHMSVIQCTVAVESTIHGVGEAHDREMQNALAVTEQITILARELRDCRSSKIHPFIFPLLLTTAEFLYERRDQSVGFQQCLDELLAAFRSVKIIGDSEQTMLDFMSMSCTKASQQMTVDLETPALGEHAS